MKNIYKILLLACVAISNATLCLISNEKNIKKLEEAAKKEALNIELQKKKKKEKIESEIQEL